MHTFTIEKTLDQSGRIELDKLPFEPGESVQIMIVSTRPAKATKSLAGSVTNYDSPFEPIAESEWLAAQ